MSQVTAENTATIERDSYQLTALDRCDSCGAQAYIRVMIGESELLFCAHHGRRHQEKLEAVATDWHDESDRLHEDR
ncbi:hypothetical protein BKA04_000044 [Cryobacterium mesophilum]|uniref:DUF7455 domain-containing protein n=1 Tax=Terrimesophilobacter mesophilus TaxID=433647 RepID=A0A4R8V8V8_9MICO|nr:hypothetical protein [Terrimesophilobacter mesophilus]MBB5631821.1 hypothetical protein [Terrimesophilobacter mesophilus]TFB78736.1 hypothetical protein E3N84_00760 [Terrimesophilobacter mesophilus]